MWQCPKCSRTFKHENQHHFCDESPLTIDHYIKEQPESIQHLLTSVRDKLREVLPEAEERISWRMPTFWKKQNIIHFAAYKNHMGLYPGDLAVAHFADQLRAYKTSKGAIQFQFDEPIPLELIAEIARWCYETGSHH